MEQDKNEFETYNPKPLPTVNVPSPKTQKNFIICLIIGSFLWSFIILGGIMGFIQLGYSDNFIPDHICDALMNESFVNGTIVGSNNVAYLISESVFTNNIIERMITNGTHYQIVEIDLISYYSQYLNLTQEANKNG